jgi:glucan phosphorylase
MTFGKSSLAAKVYIAHGKTMVLQNGPDDVNEWLGGNHGQSESPDRADDATEMDIKPKKNPLEEILHKYNPDQYEELWVEYCMKTFSTPMPATKHYNMNYNTVRKIYAKERKKIKEALADPGDTSALNLDTSP